MYCQSGMLGGSGKETRGGRSKSEELSTLAYVRADGWDLGSRFKIGEEGGGGEGDGEKRLR